MWKVIVLYDGCPAQELAQFHTQGNALAYLRRKWASYKIGKQELGLVDPDERLRSFVL